MTNVKYLLSKYCLLEFKKYNRRRRRRETEKEKQVSSPPLRKPVDREISASNTRRKEEEEKEKKEREKNKLRKKENSITYIVVARQRQYGSAGSKAIRPVSYETSSNTLIILALIGRAARVCVEKRLVLYAGTCETLFRPITRTPSFPISFCPPSLILLPPRAQHPLPFPAPDGSLPPPSLADPCASQVSVKFGSPY